MQSEFELFARKLDALLFDAEQVVQGNSSPWAPAVLKLSDDTSDLLQSWDKIKYQWPELSAVRVAWVVAGSYANAAIALLIDVSLQAQHCKNALVLGDSLKNHFKQSLVPQDFEAITTGLRVELKSLAKSIGWYENQLQRERVPISTLAIELDVSRGSLYRLADKGHIPTYKQQGHPKYLYRDEIDPIEIKRLLDLQKKQQLPPKNEKHRGQK
jgi:hypothetical protein